MKPEKNTPSSQNASPATDETVRTVREISAVVDPESIDPTEECPPTQIVDRAAASEVELASGAVSGRIGGTAAEVRGVVTGLKHGVLDGVGAVPGLSGLSRRLRGTAQRPSCDATGVLKSGRLAGLTMNGAIWAMAWPVLSESVLNSTVGLVDTTIAAKLSVSAADAISGAAYYAWFIGLITMAIGVGATALIARSIGAGKKAVARAALGQAVTLAIIGGVVVAIALALCAGLIAQMLSLQGEAARDVKLYLWAYSAGVPFSTVMFACTACARGAGDTLRPLMTMVVVNVVNLAAALTLAMPWGLNLGVTGIGAGTAIAHVVGCLIILRFHVRGATGVALSLRWMKPHAVTISRLLRLGLPNFFESFGMWVANMIVVLMVGFMSASAMGSGHAAAVAASAAGATGEVAGGLLGAHMLAIRIEAFSFLPGFSMGLAASALAGQYLGAGYPNLARRAAVRCATVAAGMMGLMGLVFIFFGSPLVAMLSPQDAHRLYTPQLLFITGLTQIPFALAIVYRSAMHGAGDVRAVMVMTWITQWGMRLPLAYIFSGVDLPIPAFIAGKEGVLLNNPFPFDLGLKGLWIGLCVEIVLRCLIYGWRFSGGAWLRARV